MQVARTKRSCQLVESPKALNNAIRELTAHIKNNPYLARKYARTASSKGFAHPFSRTKRLGGWEWAKWREHELVASDERERKERWEGESPPPHDFLRPYSIVARATGGEADARIFVREPLGSFRLDYEYEIETNTIFKSVTFPEPISSCWF